jgi:glutathione peroxidase
MGKKDGGRSALQARQSGLISAPVGLLLVVVILGAAYSFSGTPDSASASDPALVSDSASDSAPTGKGVFGFTVKNANSKKIPMSSFADKKVLLIVNTASECGFTPQYAGLQDLYTKYASEGLEIIAFPSNQFQQETGTNPEIQRFVKEKYAVTFPVMQKVVVNGANPNPERTAAAMAAAASAPPAHPLFKYLTSLDLGEVSKADWNPGLPSNAVQWNFNKFLVVDGVPTKRYGHDVEPSAIEADITAILNAKSEM